MNWKGIASLSMWRGPSANLKTGEASTGSKSEIFHIKFLPRRERANSQLGRGVTPGAEQNKKVSSFDSFFVKFKIWYVLKQISFILRDYFFFSTPIKSFSLFRFALSSLNNSLSGSNKILPWNKVFSKLVLRSYKSFFCRSLFYPPVTVKRRRRYTMDESTPA